MAMSSFRRERTVVKMEKRKIWQPFEIAEFPKIPLTTFDLQHMHYQYIQKVLLYKGVNYEEALKKLEEGLRKALVQYWPLLARLKKEGEETYIVCNNEHKGIEVIEASAENVEVAQLLTDEYNTALHEMFPYNGMLNSQGFDVPLMAVQEHPNAWFEEVFMLQQFTKLKDGIVIGFSMNHVVVDGRTAVNFMLHWADMCKNIASASGLPLYERSNLPTKSARAWIPWLLCHVALFFTPRKLQRPLKSRVFSFSETTLDKIKAHANAKRPCHLKPITTFQSLASHIWSAITRARKFHFLTFCVVCIDCRGRMNPPIPNSYFGNMVQGITTFASSCLLTGRSPSFGAELLHNLINSHGPKAIHKTSKFWGNLPDMNRYVDANCNVVVFAGSPRFKNYDMDFGWGKPELVSNGHNIRIDGLVFLQPGRGGGRSINADISLREKVMEVLEKDEKFLTGDY